MEEAKVYDNIPFKDEAYVDKLDNLRKEFERVKEYNLDLKLQIIEEKEKIQKIRAILNK
mgnify:CR=1 FL=1